jgi:hypothetical protein
MRVGSAATSACPALAQSGSAAQVPRRAREGVIGVIVQRRHDIVHNCDRPRNAPQPLKVGSARNMLTDVGAFVEVTDTHIDANWVV